MREKRCQVCSQMFPYTSEFFAPYTYKYKGEQIDSLRGICIDCRRKEKDAINANATNRYHNDPEYKQTQLARQKQKRQDPKQRLQFNIAANNSGRFPEGESFTLDEFLELYYSIGEKCGYCEKVVPLVKIEIDHIKPVSRGGRNVISNISPSCVNCNRTKGDKIWEPFFKIKSS